MTPLAHRIAKELTLPTKARTFVDRVDLLKRFDDVHCFEVSAAYSLAEELARQMPKFGADDRSSFLPARRTWLEFKSPNDPAIGRVGLFLERISNSTRALVIPVAEAPFSTAVRMDTIDLAYSPLETVFEQVQRLSQMTAGTILDETVLAFLAIINTPRIIGRRQHMPHRGLERALIRARGNAPGRFPLHAWTEIKLEILPRPVDLSGDPSREAHLTGQRALHFCRAHLRVRRGRLEIVKEHWRGDAALGIRRSRYRLED